MRRAICRRLPLVLAIALVAACGGAADSGDSGGGETLRVAVIPKGTTHDFWRSIHAGALQAAEELREQGTPVEVIWKGPLREDDREQQVQVVEGFLSQGVDGIVLAPLDDRALVRPVEEAWRAGVPVTIIDSGLQSEEIVSFVATDNREGGRLAANRMAELLGGEGRVLLLRYQEGSASTREREEGFLERRRSQHPGVQVVTSDQYAGATRETAKRTSENLLNRYGDEIEGIFTPNESSTVGMLLALQDIGKAGNIAFVGFDASETLVNALRDGELQGLVVQNPMRMGYLGVRTMVDHLLGNPVEKRVDTGVTVITTETVDAPAVQELLDPPIERYLDGM
jgi:ribose transport system substrate-binding protein